MKPELLDFVVSYDITDNRKRKKIADILDEYGQRVQYSVYEITVPSGEVRSLRSRLAKHLRKSTDTIRYYSLCQKCVAKIMFDSVRNKVNKDKV